MNSEAMGVALEHTDPESNDERWERELKDAVAREREICARIAYRHGADAVADAIRARGT